MTFGSPLTSRLASRPRTNPAATSTSNTTSVSAASVNADRTGRRNRLRTPYSHGNRRITTDPHHDADGTGSRRGLAAGRVQVERRVGGGIAVGEGRARIVDGG